MWTYPTPRMIERFEAQYQRGDPEECWRWHGRKRKGYGLGGGWGGYRAHRSAWRLANEMATIPRGYHVHHTCGTRDCVNPAHLELLTDSEHGSLHRGTNQGTKLGTRLKPTQTNANPENPVNTGDVG